MKDYQKYLMCQLYLITRLVQVAGTETQEDMVDHQEQNVENSRREYEDLQYSDKDSRLQYLYGKFHITVPSVAAAIQNWRINYLAILQFLRTWYFAL